MRSTLAFALHAAFALLAVACGGTSSSSLGDAGGGDGGGGGCGDPPPLHCYGGCNGQTVSAECVNGSWTCPPEPAIACVLDAGPGDDGGANDAGPAGDGGIDCMGLTCNAATQYCDIRGGGVQLPDAGSNMTISCPDLPTMPCDAGTGCACIPNACICTDDGGAIKNECFFP